MATPILVMGEPGTGKSVSVRNLDSKSTFIIATDSKPLPLPKSSSTYKTVLKDNGKLDLQNSNYFETTDASTVKALLTKISAECPHIKTVVIDTITSLMEAEYMERLKEKGFGKFEDIALNTYDLITMLRPLREDLTIVVTSHTETNYDIHGEMRTSFFTIGGKLIKEKIRPEKNFHMVLYTDVTLINDKPEYHFLTQNNGKNTCRSPLGLFNDQRIPNDLAYVIEEYKKYER